MDRRFLEQRLHQNQRKDWSTIYAPQANLNFWLNLVAKRFAENFGPALGAYEIIASEWTALRELYRPGRLSPLDLGHALGMTKGGASKLVDRLVRKGLVKKTVGIYDRRCRTVELTEDGKYVVGCLASSEGYVESHFFQSLRFHGRRGLMEALKRTLGAEQCKYLDPWITPDGQGGQWAFQADWRNSLHPRPSDNATDDGSEESLEFLL